MVEETIFPSSRGLIDFDVGPLRRFTGILDSMPKEPQTYEGRTKPSMRVTVNIKEIEVLEATEPYHFPVFFFQVTESNRKKSRWGVLSESFNAVADSQYTEVQLDPSSPEFIKAADRMDFKDIMGKNRLGFVLADGEDGRPEPPMLYDGRANEDKPTPAWMVYEIEGVGVSGGQGANAMEIAKTLLDGKTLADFNREALANPIIKNSELLTIISLPPSAVGSFANVMVSTGEFTKDVGGVFHKVVPVAPAA